MTIEELPRLKWTIDEYHQLIELGLLADKNVELLQGEIIEMVPEDPEHSDPSDKGHEYLLILLGDQARVRSAKPITLPSLSEPEPDIAVCERREYRSHHPYPENIFWVVEYLNSSLQKDRDIKSKIYAKAGIREYWRSTR
jgi:Uma2 family endonuclease